MDKNDFFNELSMNNSLYEEDFLRDILYHQSSFPSMSDSINTITTADAGGAAATTTTAVSSPTSIISGLASFSDLPATSSSYQSTYILSFDNSMLIPATTGDGGYEKRYEAANTRASLKRTPESNNSEPKAHQRTRKSRSSSESLDHIMSERKRRQELTEKFIALSATIPGLKKIDKSSVLSEAINHMKKLKERVRDLEELNKKMSGELSSVKKSSCHHHLNAEDEDHHHHHHHQNTISSAETMSSNEYCFRIINEALPEVEARVLHNQVLIRIHCEKQASVLLNILAQLKSLHFSVISTSVLTFANSALDITIIAEVEEHKITVEEVVKKLRLALLKTSEHQN